MSLPSTQQALAVLEKQGPWGQQAVDVDKPGPGEVLIRVEATALNPVDWKIQAFGFAVSEYPAILGSDSAGVVVEVGEGVKDLTVGDKVFHQGRFINRFATFKQYTISPAELTAKIPGDSTFDQAASVPVGAAAAFVGLYGKAIEGGGAGLAAPWQDDGKGKYSKQPIVVLGGSTSVGQYVLQFARLSGFSPIITTASPRNADLVKSLGATHFIDRSASQKDIVAAVKKITSEPIKFAFDAVSEASTQSVAYEVLSSGGTLVLVLQSQIDKSKIDPTKRIVTTFGTVHTDNTRELGLQLYSGGQLSEYLKTGDLKPNKTEVLSGGLAGIPDGLKRLQNNEVSGHKLIAHPQDTK